MLSALARVEDRAEGLDAGAQDYIVKPFQLSELIARLEVQLRRSAPRQEPLRMADLVYDPATRTVTGGARPVPLTEREGELLAWLLARGGALATRGEIFDALWAPHGGATENVVDVYIGYLRRKLSQPRRLRPRAAHAARARLPTHREGRRMIARLLPVLLLVPATAGAGALSDLLMAPNLFDGDGGRQQHRL